MKDGAYAVYLYEYKSVETYWKALHVNGRGVTNFVSFGVEHIPKEIKHLLVAKI